MALAFSTDGSTVIAEKIVRTSYSGNVNVENKYPLSQCLVFLKQKQLKRVALQFPDDLLPDTSQVLSWLSEREKDVEFFILADTSYGSCCADEVGAEHYNADSLVHFGHACLSSTKRLPIFYVFEKKPLDIEDCCNKLTKTFDDETKLILLYDLNYHHLSHKLFTIMKTKFKSVEFCSIEQSTNCKVISDWKNENDSNSKDMGEKMKTINDVICHRCGSRTIYLPKSSSLQNYTMLYVGGESLSLTNLMLNWNTCTFYSYNPHSKELRKETLQVNKVLMKRYYMTEKVKDAKIVGILVGTLGLSSYLLVIEKLKALLKKVGKKYYTFVVGKLNVAKLANFMEIDIFVFVSCPENSLIDSSNFYRPIVTPYEVEIACNPECHWTGAYVTDFQQLLPGGSAHVDLPEGNIEETMDMSLVTGGVRNLGVQKNQLEISSELMPRGDNFTVALSGAHSAGEYLAQRQWQGLEMQLGQTDVVKAVQGSRGIAIGYEEEPETKNKPVIEKLKKK